MNKCKYNCKFLILFSVTIDKNKEIRIKKYCQHCSAIHIRIIKNSEIKQKKEAPNKEPQDYINFPGGKNKTEVNQGQEKQPNSRDCYQSNLF